MRTVSSQSTETLQRADIPVNDGLEVFSATLSDGRVITIREMTGRDLLYIEDELSDYRETRRSFHILERLNVGTDKVSFDQIADLTFKDIKLLTELVGKVSSIGEEEEKSDPKSK
jgi:hypothetical protein